MVRAEARATSKKETVHSRSLRMGASFSVSALRGLSSLDQSSKGESRARVGARDAWS